MRSFPLLLAASLLACSILHAQKSESFRFGMKGGIDFANVNGEDPSGNKTGFVGTTLYGGFFGEQRLAGSSWLKSELFFSWVDEWHFLEATLQVRQELNGHFSAFLGPKLDYALDKGNPDKYCEHKTWGLSLDTGIQYNIFGRFFAEGRYTFGISKQYSDSFLDINEGQKNHLRFGIGLRF